MKHPNKPIKLKDEFKNLEWIIEAIFLYGIATSDRLSKDDRYLKTILMRYGLDGSNFKTYKEIDYSYDKKVGTERVRAILWKAHRTGTNRIFHGLLKSYKKHIGNYEWQ